MKRILAGLMLIFGIGSATAQEPTGNVIVHMVPSSETAMAGPTPKGFDPELDAAIRAQYGNAVIVTSIPENGENRAEILVIEPAETAKELEQIYDKMLSEYGMPNLLPCTSLGEGSDDAPDADLGERTVERGYRGDPGTNPVPSDYPSAQYTGSKGGGCGTWATMMCNRILGVTDPAKPVDKGEWRDIARGIGQNAGGGSSTAAQAEYYNQLGYCSSTHRFTGTQADYQTVAAQLKKGCDLKIISYREGPEGQSDAHVETVTNVYDNGGQMVLEMNSWGDRATITGSSSGGFHHSSSGRNFSAGKWPRNETSVAVQSTCPCDASKLPK